MWKCLKPVPNGLRVKWDDNVKKFELLEQITEVHLGFPCDPLSMSIPWQTWECCGNAVGSCHVFLPFQDVSVCRTVTPSAAMGIISPRDFVDVILVKKYEDGTISSNGAPPFLLPSPFLQYKTLEVLMDLCDQVPV